MASAELRVLGPIEVVGKDGPIDLGPSKLRALLSMLAIRHPATADADVLVDALWGEAPPASAFKLVQVYVSQLRRRLPAGVGIATEAAGYRLDVPTEAVDARRFERLVAEGRAAAAGNPALGASLLGRALALWRGEAYADVRYEPFAAAEADRLEALRDLAVSARLATLVDLGRSAEALPELRAAVASDPTHEPTARLAMLALHRTGASAEALDVFDRVDAALRSELGEPAGADLVALRDAIQRRDPGLLVAVSAAGPQRPAVPHAATRLIGRDRELGELRALLARADVRLVSLTGAGGSGKSRLAAELARLIADDFANGVTWVELASLADPELVVPTIARALELDPGPDPTAAVVDGLAEREQLLVLDNLEHLREAAASLVRLLSALPRLRIVATTRAVLHVSGEHVYPVSPLGEAAATSLFVERALAADGTLRLRPEDEAVVAEICRRLDGLPLAIELAAARVRALGLPALRDRLTSRLSTLTGGPRDLPARQQTLRETLAWSTSLLDAGSAAVLARLAVFPSGCTMAAAVAVACADDSTMSELVDHSLVQPVDGGGDRRYRLLETVREHAYEQLGDERRDVEARLIAWVAELAHRADLNGDRPVSPAALDGVEREIDTVRDALRHAASAADPTAELAIASAIWRFWWIRGYVAEGLERCEDILRRRGHVATTDGVRVIRAAASLAWTLDDLERATELGNEALALAKSIDDAFEEVCAYNLLGVIDHRTERIESSKQYLAAAAARARSAGIVNLEATAKLNLGITHLEAGELDDARALLVDVLRQREAEASVEGIGFARINLGETELEAGNFEQSERHFRAAIDAFTEIGFQARQANALQGLAAVEARTGRALDSARHLGTAAALLAPIGWGSDGSGQAPAAAELARVALGDERFDRAFEEGRLAAATGT